MCFPSVPKPQRATPPATDVQNQQSVEANRMQLPFNSLGIASTILTSGLGTTGKAPTSTVNLGGGA